MNIFLLRHFESEKNIGNRLSGTDQEGLTDCGGQDCELFSGFFQEICNEKNIKIDEICSANSKRARETAEIIGRVFNIYNINFYEALRSTKAGRIAGKSIDEIQQEDPFFAKNYELYRKGLLNSYYFDSNWMDDQKELKRDFETRVLDCFMNIIKRNSMNSSILLVAHRASITAILIHVARKMGIYPNDFYGNVESSTGGLSYISLDGGKWDIEFINKTKEEIKDAFNIVYNKG